MRWLSCYSLPPLATISTALFKPAYKKKSQCLRLADDKINNLRYDEIRCFFEHFILILRRSTMTNSKGCCQIGKKVICIIIFAVAIQLFFCLMAIAVAAGNALLPIVAFSHMLSWPIYFISLALAVILGVVRCLKSCGDKSQACCCSSSQECSTSKACSTSAESCSPCSEEK